MWLVTQWGFLSVVADHEHGKPDRMKVRARRKEDLDRFRRHYCPNLTKTEGPASHRDYPFRAYCSMPDLAAAMHSVVADIDYSNFKSRVSKLEAPSHSRSGVYSRVWSTLLDLEETGAHGMYGRPWRGSGGAWGRDWDDYGTAFDTQGRLPLVQHNTDLAEWDKADQYDENGDYIGPAGDDEEEEFEDLDTFCETHQSFGPCEHNGARLTLEGWQWPEDIEAEEARAEEEAAGQHEAYCPRAWGSQDPDDCICGVEVEAAFGVDDLPEEMTRAVEPLENPHNIEQDPDCTCGARFGTHHEITCKLIANLFRDIEEAK